MSRVRMPESTSDTAAAGPDGGHPHLMQDPAGAHVPAVPQQPEEQSDPAAQNPPLGTGPAGAPAPNGRGVPHLRGEPLANVFTMLFTSRAASNVTLLGIHVELESEMSQRNSICT